MKLCVKKRTTLEMISLNKSELKKSFLTSLFAKSIIAILLLLSSLYGFAGGGVGYKGVKLNLNGTNGWYNIHGLTWSYSGCTGYQFYNGGASNWGGTNLGTYSTSATLQLTGYAVVGWTDNSDYVAGKLEYKIWKSTDAEPGDWTVINIGNYQSPTSGATQVVCTSGNDRVVGFDNGTTSFQPGVAGTYNFKVKGFGRMQYTGGGGGSFGVNDGTELTATFTIVGPSITSTSSSITSNSTQTYKGATLTINGNDLSSINAVKIGGSGGASCTSITAGATQVTAVVPDGTTGGTIWISDGTNSITSSDSYTNLGFISTADDNWNLTSTWLGGSLPAASSSVTINHNVTVNAAVSHAPSTITINSTKSLVFGASGTLTATTITNNGTIDMSSGGTLTIASGGTLANGTSTFTRGSGSVVFSGSGTISGTIAVNDLSVAGGVNVGNACTVHGTLTINSGGFLSTNSPTYGGSSTLRYNSGGTYGRSIEWNATSSAGYPHHIQISNNTTLNVVNGANSYKKAGGNLTVDNGATFSISGLTAGSGGVGVEFMGNIINDGTISLSSSTNQRLKGVTLTNGSSNNSAVVILSDANGGDLELTGNYADNATFTSNGRAVFFTGGSNQEIGGTASDPFNIDYVVITKSGGVVQMNKTLLIGAPNDGTGLTLTSANDILVLNGNSLTLGTSGKACAISGLGSIRGSSTSSMTINGTGALGTLRFDAGTAGGANLNSLTINRSTSGAVTLGSALNIFDQLTVTNGTLTTGGNLTLKSTATQTARVNAIGAGGSISGDVTVERYFPSKRAWRLVTAPVFGSTNNSISSNWQQAITASPNTDASSGTTGVLIWGPTGSNTGLSTGPRASMRGWNNTLRTFANVTDANSPLFSNSNTDNPLSFFLFVTGSYNSTNIANGQAAVRVSAKGALRQGSQTFRISSSDVVANGFYMVGNPYASPVNHGYNTSSNSYGVAQNNTNGTIWVWDANLNTVGGYVSFQQSTSNLYSVGGSWVSGANYTPLQSGQAFFVQAASSPTATDLTVEFNEASKGGVSNSIMFRNTNEVRPEMMRVTLQRYVSGNPIISDGAVALFYPDGVKEVNDKDGSKFLNPSDNLMFKRNSANLTFEHRPTIQNNDTLFLQMQSTSTGNYRLVLEPSDFNLNNNLEAILEDTYLEKEQPLSLEAAVPYDFTIDGNTASSGDRFRIVFRNKGIAPPQDIEPKNTISLYPNPIKAGESLSIQMHKQEVGKYTVVIYNLMGVQVQQQVILHAGVNAVQNIKLNSNLPAGTYLVNILDASSRKVQAIKINIQ